MLPSVAAMRSGGAWSLRALWPLVREGAAQTWIHVAMEGTWEGHPAGPFTLDRKVFEQCVRNFAAQANPAPLDYEHTTTWAPEARAAGWVHDLEVREVGGVAHLWARVELTDRAATAIRAGEYRFSSGVFEFDSVDRRTAENVGCRMSSLALTNLPFIDGQEPIRLSQRAARALLETTMDTYSKKDLLAALEQIKGTDVSMEQLHDVLKGMAAAAGKTEPSEPPEAPETAEAGSAPLSDGPSAALDAAPPLAPPPAALAPPPPSADPMTTDAGAMLVSKLQAALPEMDAAAILAALDAKLAEVAAVLRGEGESAGESAVLKAQAATIKALSEKVEKLERGERERKETAEQAEKTRKLTAAKERIDGLIKTHPSLEADREALVQVALSQPVVLETMVRALSATPPLGRHASATAEADLNTSLPVAPEDEESISALMAGMRGMRVKGRLLSEDDLRQRASARLAELKKQTKSAPSA